jgi:hypothetical protein
MGFEGDGMEEPILFRCQDCFAYTIIFESTSHGRMYLTPNRCGHCGAKNPNPAKIGK